MLEQYSDAGSMAAFFSSTEDNVVEAVETVADEMARLLREGISEWELEKAKNIIRGSMIRNMESTTSRMYRLARSYVLRGEAVPFQADLDRLDAVGEEDVMSVAEDIIRHDRLNVVVYGKDSGKLSSLDIGSLEF